MLALSHRLQEAIDRWDYRDRAELARQLGFTRARISQLLDLQHAPAPALTRPPDQPKIERSGRVIAPPGGLPMRLHHAALFLAGLTSAVACGDDGKSGNQN